MGSVQGISTTVMFKDGKRFCCIICSTRKAPTVATSSYFHFSNCAVAKFTRLTVSTCDVAGFMFQILRSPLAQAITTTLCQRESIVLQGNIKGVTIVPEIIFVQHVASSNKGNPTLQSMTGHG